MTVICHYQEVFDTKLFSMHFLKRLVLTTVNSISDNISTVALFNLFNEEHVFPYKTAVATHISAACLECLHV